MGNTQQPNQELKIDVDQNVNQFLQNMTVQNNPTNFPSPSTPCFQQKKINIVPKEVLLQMYKQDDNLKQELQFQRQLKSQQKQIQTAKFNYFRKKHDNVAKLKQIQNRKKNCKRIYEQYDSMQESEDQKQKRNNQTDQNELVYGNKVCFKQKNPMNEFHKYKYAKEQTQDETGDYKNWKIYKKKIANEQLSLIQQQENKLKAQQARLKQKYQQLLDKKQQRLSSSATYHALRQKQNNTFTTVTQSPKIEQKTGNESQLMQSFFSLNKNTENHSLDVTNLNQTQKSQKPQNQMQDTNEPPSFVYDLLSGGDNRNPQNIKAHHPQVDFLAKQIFHYQIYSSKRRTSFVHTQEEYLKYTLQQNQYPSNRKNYGRPVRCEQNLKERFASMQKSRSKRKKKKDKRLQIETQQKNQQVDNSVYLKVYEKIPKKETKKMMYSEEERKLKQVENFYPWQESKSKALQKPDPFPKTMKVNDGLKPSTSQDVQYFRIGPKQASSHRLDAVQRKSTNLSARGEILELTDEQKQLARRRRYQRNYEARILQRVKQKHL